MKGLYPEEELQDLYAERPDIKETESHILTVPGCDAQRHIVMLKQITN